MIVVPDPLRLSVPVRASALREVRRLLRGWLAAAGAADPDGIVLAVDEAVSNAIEHGRLSTSDDDDGPIIVHVAEAGGGVHIEVSDPGHWKPPTPDESRGRGFPIMTALMDDVSVERSGGTTVVRMQRRLT